MVWIVSFLSTLLVFVLWAAYYNSLFPALERWVGSTPAVVLYWFVLLVTGTFSFAIALPAMLTGERELY